jgi:serine/threonine-protein kinase
MLAPTRQAPPLSSTLKAGDVVSDRYELRRDLGGAAGHVFEAVHLFTGRSVALKLVAEGAPEKEERALHARLTREAKALASVRHPGVVEVLDGGVLADGTPFVVMEMLDGRTLEGLVAARGKIALEDTLAIAIQLSRALEAAHGAGIVHRDVQPSNVLVVRDHRQREAIKLIDFGLARVEAAKEDKLTGIGALIGTPAYMSPEQLLGLDDVDARSDVYALGVTLFECLTGRVPYEGTYQEVLLQVCSPGPVPTLDPVGSGVPAPLAAIVRKAMDKERAARYPRMRELRAALLAAYPKAREHSELFGPPVDPDAAAPAGPDARRKLVRAPYVTPVRIVVGDLTIDGRTEDISTGGMLVVCHQVCPTDQKATIRFALPIEGKVAAVDVQVRWVKAARANDPQGARALGVEFVDAPADVTRSIARYVSLMTVPDAAP